MVRGGGSVSSLSLTSGKSNFTPVKRSLVLRSLAGPYVPSHTQPHTPPDTRGRTPPFLSPFTLSGEEGREGSRVREPSLQARVLRGGGE